MRQAIKQKLQTAQPEQILLAILWGLPLVYVHDSGVNSITARWALIIAVAMLLLVSAELRLKTLKSLATLGKLPKVLLGVLVLGMLLSTVFSSESWALRLVGWGGENLGVLSWLSFLIIAVALRTQVRVFLRSPWALGIGGLVCGASVVVDTRLLVHGFRLPGLLLIATSTGIYAALILGLALWHMLFLKKNHRLAMTTLLIATVVLLLCQSRAAQFAAITSCVVYAAYLGRHSDRRWLLPLFIGMVLILIPLAGGSYFQRMRGEGVASGVAYRGDIYRLSAHEVLHQRVLVGLGASGLPQAINDHNRAPAGILETLNQNYVFLSAHDIFLDTALYFGLIASAALFCLVLLALRSLWGNTNVDEQLLVGGAFFTLVVNGLLNVPSIELTSLLIIVTIAALPSRLVAKKSPKT